MDTVFSTAQDCLRELLLKLNVCDSFLPPAPHKSCSFSIVAYVRTADAERELHTARNPMWIAADPHESELGCNLQPQGKVLVTPIKSCLTADFKLQLFHEWWLPLNAEPAV
eukprot:TRINITY_DN4483_c0_g1_i2.p1 TRINITY_DN4483_c0_g1~~TRINITY_DN4483_c0_g1_i2.p1  ORF type:complete len:111 (+),score=34.51 TRINITY_DN4483_c0_g1_i2:164-496(+)